jgi:hypothetical protein
LFGANHLGLIDLVCCVNRFGRAMTYELKKKGQPCERTEFSKVLPLLVSQ